MCKMSKILFYNARIWRKTGEIYSWILFSQESGNILNCGIENPPIHSADRATDMKLSWVFPGFHDSHLHISDTGGFTKFDLKRPETIDIFKQRLKKLSQDLSPGEWLVGNGWDHHSMERMPTCEDIDEVVPNNHVVLFRVCTHICVVSSSVLSVAGITKSTKDPINGHIAKFSADHKKAGDLNGVLYEDGGVHLILPHIPELSKERKKQNILAGLNRCLKEGVTSVHTCDDNYWSAYVDLAKSNLLPIHCYCSPFSSNFNTPNFPSRPGETYSNLTCEFVKVFIDGALGTETAALSLPYCTKNSDGTDNYGVLQKTEEEFEELMSAINNAGYRLEIHVIGDRAADIALVLLEKCKVSPSMRPIFVHCQILNLDLIARMKKCGVVPTVQPSFVPTDSTWIDKHLPVELKTCIYPWKTLLDQGIICGGSSDSPVETTNPLQGIYDAIFRPKPNGEPFIEHECLSFVDAVGLYTTGSAYADGVELIKGQLEIGFQADIVVLDVPLLSNGDPADLPNHPAILKHTKVKEVWVKGVTMYKRA